MREDMASPELHPWPGTSRPSPTQVKANELYSRRKVLQDNIHGKIELHPVCVRIINTPQFNRLRHIKQLGTCYYVYPTACHNRFEHSIGVCHLAGKLLRKIKDRQPDEDISEIDILCVEIAGLCHDLGQGPWCQVFEEFKHKKGITYSSKAIARKMFEYMLECNDGELEKDIQTILQECRYKKFEQEDFEFIKEMIDDPKDIETDTWPYKGRLEDKSYLYEIVENNRNGVDVDKWDYLVRDSHMLGLNVTLDYARCFASARVILSNGCYGTNDGETHTNGHVIVPRKQICYREKNAFDLKDMFNASNSLKRRAYQHKTHRLIGLMICDVMEAANDDIKIGGKKITETVDDMRAFTLLTDDVLQIIMNAAETEHLEQDRGTNRDESGLSKARNILLDIMHRRFYRSISREQNEVTEDDDQLEKVRFYTKNRLDVPFKMEKAQDIDQQTIPKTMVTNDPRDSDRPVTSEETLSDKHLPEPAPACETLKEQSSFHGGGVEIRQNLN